MVKVKLIYLDGYADWIPETVTDITLLEFTPEALTFHLTEGETNDPMAVCNDTYPVVMNGTISLMGEEQGWIAVLIR